jgi:MinD superfamily P-loop ATPase
VRWDKKIIGTIFEGKKGNIKFLSGELKISEPLSEFIVSEIKKQITKKGFVIIDTAAGTHCDVISALEICDKIFCVTEPTPLGMHDAELIIKLVEIMKKPYEIILNRYEGDATLLKPLLNKYEKTDFFKIPYSKKIIDNYSQGIPVEDESIFSIIKKIKESKI